MLENIFIRIFLLSYLCFIPYSLAAPTSITGFHLGAGGAYTTYAWDYSITSLTGSPSVYVNTSQGSEVRSVAEIGYTQNRGHGFIGLKAKFNDDKATSSKTQDSQQYIQTLEGRISGIALSGVRITDNASFYLGVGYSCIFFVGTLQNFKLIKESVTGKKRWNLNGGIAEVGLRFYFSEHPVFWDVSYNYSIYSPNKSSLVFFPPANSFAAKMGGPHKISLNEIAMTLNYLFKI